MEQMTRDEMNQLQQTVKTLREQLEEYEREQK
jgi:HAMP domain-containing protein